VKCQPPNQQLQRTVIGRRGRGACASLHYAHAPRFTRHRAAAELRRYAMRTVAALVTAFGLSTAASAETWILPTETLWKPDLATFSRMANVVEAAFQRAASEENRDVAKWDSYTIQYHGMFSDEGVRVIALTGMCEDQAKSAAEHFDLTKVVVGIADGGTCIFSAFYDADQQMLRTFYFHGEA
jgi:hypothetical protein